MYGISNNPFADYHRAAEYLNPLIKMEQERGAEYSFICGLIKSLGTLREHAIKYGIMNDMPSLNNLLAHYQAKLKSIEAKEQNNNELANKPSSLSSIVLPEVESGTEQIVNEEVIKNAL